MAKGKIIRKDLVEDKVLAIGKDYAKSLNPAIIANQKWVESFAPIKQAALEYAKLEKGFKVSKGRKEFLALKSSEIKLQKESSQALKAEKTALVEIERVKQAKINTEKTAIDLKAKKTRLTIQETKEIERLSKNEEKARKVSATLSNEYNKQSKILLELRNSYKHVALTEGEASKKAILLKNEIQKLDSRLKKVDANVGQFQRSVGNYGKAMSGAVGAARSMASAMGAVGGAFLFVQVMRNSIGIIREYGKSNATLSGILQIEKEDMKELRAESQRLGAETVKTANEVVGLQIAYARLGFSQNEIIDLTEATIQGSIALNAELSDTANLAGAMVNTFDEFTTTDAPEIMDVLALATAKSALNFEKLQKGLPIVSGAANAAGVPFTKLVALMGKLADSGIDVSTSSTAIRNIFIESAKQGLNYGQIIEKIKSSQDKLTAANDEFGKRAAVSATVLAKNIDATKELDLALQGAAGTAESMANKELDTLDGAIKLLSSAWQGVILNMDDANSVGSKLKRGIQFLAENMKQIVSVLGSVTKGFLVYKATIFTGALIKFTKATELYKIAVIAVEGGIKKAVIAFRALKTAQAGTPWGLIALALGGIVTLWAAFSDGAKEAAKEQRGFNKTIDEGEAKINKFTKALSRYKKGQDRANAAADALLTGQIKLNKVLDDSSATDFQKEEVLKRFNNLHGIRVDRIAGVVSVITEGLLPAEQKQITSALIQSEALNKIIKENEDYVSGLEDKSLADDKDAKKRLKRLKDNFEYEKYIAQQKIALQNEVLKDENSTFDEQFSALEQKADEEIKLAILVRDFKLTSVKKGSDAELLILAQFEAEKKRIIGSHATGEGGIDTAVLKDKIDKEKAIKEKALADNLKAENDVFKTTLNNYDSLEKAIEAHEKRVAKIKKDYAIEALNVQVAALEALISTSKKGSTERINAEKKLAEAQLAISNITTEQFVVNEGTKVEKVKLSAEDILKISSDLTAALTDLTNAIFDRKIQNLENELSQLESDYDRKLALAEGDDVQTQLLEEQQEQRRLELEKKIKQEKTKQAKANKAAALIQAAISTALGIINATNAPFPLNIAMPIIVGALGAIQIAAIAATPIPKYRHGTKNHKGGFAELGDGGVSEVYETPSGVIGVTPNRPTLYDLPKGTKVHKSVEDYNRLLRASILASVDINNDKASAFQASQTLDFYDKNILIALRENTKAVKNSKSDVYVERPKSLDFNHELFKLKNTDWDA